MSYVIYNIDTTIQYRKRARSWGCWKDTWNSKGAATRELNAAERSGAIENKADYAIAEISEFRKNIEKQITKTVPGTGEKVTMPINTPICCDPTSETYMCM